MSHQWGGRGGGGGQLAVQQVQPLSLLCLLCALHALLLLQGRLQLGGVPPQRLELRLRCRQPRCVGLTPLPFRQRVFQRSHGLPQGGHLCGRFPHPRRLLLRLGRPPRLCCLLGLLLRVQLLPQRGSLSGGRLQLLFPLTVQVSGLGSSQLDLLAQLPPLSRLLLGRCGLLCQLLTQSGALCSGRRELLLQMLVHASRRSLTSLCVLRQLGTKGVGLLLRCAQPLMQRSRLGCSRL